MQQSLLFVAFLVLPLSLTAQSAPQPIVLNGLDSLVTGNCEDAVRSWTKTWTESDAPKAQQLVASCSYLNSMGQIYGYDLIRTLDVTPNLQRVYAVPALRTEPGLHHGACLFA